MCTVIWSFKSHGELALCFNRDEKHTRAAGLPPQVWPEGFLAPVDATAGGTWLAVRRGGMVLALLNHYPVGFTPVLNGESRGALIPALAAQLKAPELPDLRTLVSERMNPFRLLCLAPNDLVPTVFTWDGSSLTRQRPAPRAVGLLTSSSWNTAPVVAARHTMFRAWKKKYPYPLLEDLREFHRQAQHPRGSAWAVCMSREDARTVSMNTIQIANGQAVMTHQLRTRSADSFNADIHTMQMQLVATA